MKSLNYVRSLCDIVLCSTICVKFRCSLIFVYFVYLVIFFRKGWMMGMDIKSIWMCVDVCMPWFFFVCIWPWHEGAGRFGQWGASWCQLASGHMVQSHQIAITGQFWLYTDVLTLSLLSPSIPLFSIINPASLSASLCLDVDFCSGNTLELIHHSF